jgi:hypothetical protein
MPTERDIAAQWLAGLHPLRRDQLLALQPGDVMPRTLALDLAVVGVTVVPAYFDGLLGPSVKAEYGQPDALVRALDAWRREHP